MEEVTKLMKRIEKGDELASNELFPIVYNELRRIAQQKMAGESPGQTLQVTSLVHEAYLRLIGDQQWENKSHFFGAAAESMRRILVDRARRKRAAKRGGSCERVELHENVEAINEPVDDVMAISESLVRFEEIHPDKAQLVKLRYFVGMTLVDAAKVMGISVSTADRRWAFAKAWLLRDLRR